MRNARNTRPYSNPIMRKTDFFQQYNCLLIPLLIPFRCSYLYVISPYCYHIFLFMTSVRIWCFFYHGTDPFLDCNSRHLIFLATYWRMKKRNSGMLITLEIVTPCMLSAFLGGVREGGERSLIFRFQYSLLYLFRSCLSLLLHNVNYLLLLKSFPGVSKHCTDRPKTWRT